MEVKTERLSVIPLGNDELAELVKQYQQAAPELSLAYQEMLENCIRYPEQAVWYTAWKICRTKDGAEVGYAGFKGYHGGSVEIGYGIEEGFEGQGYATEAVCGLCQWAFGMPEILSIEAETDPQNEASKRVLQKAGFVETGLFGEEGPRYCRRRLL